MLRGRNDQHGFSAQFFIVYQLVMTPFPEQVYEGCVHLQSLIKTILRLADLIPGYQAQVVHHISTP